MSQKIETDSGNVEEFIQAKLASSFENHGQRFFVLEEAELRLLLQKSLLTRTDYEDLSDTAVFDQALAEFQQEPETVDFRNYLKDEYILQLRDCRIKAGLTQSRLAEMVGCGKQHISRWETGKVFPNMTTIQKLASVLNVRLYGDLLSNKSD